MSRSLLLPAFLLTLVSGAFPAPGQDVERAIALKPTAAQAEPRTALIIGNGAYREAPLTNPVNDARAIGMALRQCGFKVTVLENATREQMGTALRDFGSRLASGGVGLFYFAGHGMQVKGRNFLIPVNADVASEDEVAYTALDAEAVLAKMESAKNRLNIVILDACRNNPFARSFRSTSAGLAQMDAPAGSYLAFATAPGRTASDGRDGNGLYTAHLLQALAVPGLKVEDTFKRVRAGVLQASEGQQVPWESSSITGDFYFVPPAYGSSAPAAAAAPASLELAFWNSVKDSRTPDDFEAYLKRYPEGAFADLARNRLKALKPEPVQPPPPQPTPASPGGRDRFGALLAATADANAPKAFVGLRTQELSPELRKQYQAGSLPGILVVEVIKGTGAEVAGLQPGDVIRSLRGSLVTSNAQFSQLVSGLRPGWTVVLGITRAGVLKQVPITLGTAPANLTRPAPPAAPPAPAPASGPRVQAAAPRLRVTLALATPELCRRFRLPVGAEGLIVMGLDPKVTVSGMLPLGTLIQAAGGRALRALEDQDALLPYAGAPLALTVIRPGHEQPEELLLPVSHGLVQP